MPQVEYAPKIEFNPAPVEKRPFAFDLGRERDLIRQHGDGYKDFFMAQAHYYAKESYGKVPKVEYSHDIGREIDGAVKLRFGPNGEYAEKSYMNPVFDESLPSWYRKRSGADVRWTRSLQDKLRAAVPGDSFIDLSPTEFGVSIEDRKKWGFGWHSFIRIHQVVYEDGVEKLISRGIRNYLDLPEQKQLYQDLTGEKIKEGEDILCKVGNLNESLGLGHIEKKIKDLWDKTPEDRRIWSEEDQLQKSEEEMEHKLADLDKWLEGIFYLMKNNAWEGRIEEEFHGWENAIKASVKGESFDFASLRKIDVQAFIDHKYDPQAFAVQGFINREYKAGANGCGLGSGFGGGSFMGVKFGSNTQEISGPMSYPSMTFNEGGRVLCCTCPFCGKEVEAKISKGKISCPKCDAEADWSETAAGE